MTTAYDLNLRHLRLLPVIAATGSLSTAARRAGMSQSALSQALAKLETAFGVTLFARTPGGVAPTAAGKRIVRRVERALQRMADAFRRAGSTTKGGDPNNYITAAHVRGLLYLAEAGSFVRAAAEAGVSVPRCTARSATWSDCAARRWWSAAVAAWCRAAPGSCWRAVSGWGWRS